VHRNIVALSCSHFFGGNLGGHFAFLPRFLIRGTIFGGEKNIHHKMCVEQLYTFLCKTLDSKKNSVRYYHTFV
jgi:hypothetical protein